MHSGQIVYLFTKIVWKNAYENNLTRCDVKWSVYKLYHLFEFTTELVLAIILSGSLILFISHGDIWAVYLSEYIKPIQQS